MIDVPESTASEEPKRGRSKRRGEEYGAPSLLPLPPYFSPSAHFAWVSTQPGAAAASAPLRAAPESSKHSECRRPGPPPLAGPGSGASMEHLGPHHLHPGHAEPISFGIDQILNSPDQDSAPAPRGPDGASYLGGPPGGRPGATYPSLPASFAGLGAPFEDAGSYSVNLSLAPAGVIRVPAHRPLPGAVPPPLPSALPAMPSVPAVSSLGGLNFPWMESSRRFVKDRFTGEQGGQTGAGPRLSTGQRRRALRPPLRETIPEAQGRWKPQHPGPETSLEGWGRGGIREFGGNKPVPEGRGGLLPTGLVPLGTHGQRKSGVVCARPGGTGSAWGLNGSRAGLGFKGPRVSPQRRRRSRPSR